MKPAILVNGSLLNEPVGSATYARAIIAELVGAEVWHPRTPARAAAPRAVWLGKLLRELTFRFRPAQLRLHPYWAAAIDGRSVVIALDTIDFDTEGPLLRRVHLTALRAAGSVVTLSHEVAGQLAQLTASPVGVVHPLPDPPFFQTPLTAAPGGLEIGYWGGWHARKDMPVMMAALARSGHDLTLRATNASRVTPPAGLPLVDAGNLDTAGVVGLADACVMSVYPSLREGFGLPVAESLLRGRPVLARHLKVYDEFVTFPDRGLVFIDPHDPASVSRGVERARELARDPEAVRSALAETTLEQARRRLRRQLRTVLPAACVIPDDLPG